MSYNKDNIDELYFLSMEFKNKLKKIASEMSSFLLLSTFRDLERDWFHADRKACDAVKILFELMGDRISELIKEMFDEGLVLTSIQKKNVLKYLNAETEKNRVAIRLQHCSRTFFEKMFDKFSSETAGAHSPNNNKRPHGENTPILGIAPCKKIDMNPKLYISLTIQPTLRVFPTFASNGNNGQGEGAFQTMHRNEIYKIPSRNTVDANANTLTEMPRNKTIPEKKKSESKSPNQQPVKLCMAIPSKACNEVGTQKINNDKSLNSIVDCATAVKKEENDKPIKIEAKKKVAKQNRGRELFGNDSDDVDSDVEITGSYTVAIPDEKKIVSFSILLKRIDLDSAHNQLKNVCILHQPKL